MVTLVTAYICPDYYNELKKSILNQSRFASTLEFHELGILRSGKRCDSNNRKHQFIIMTLI